MVFSSIIFLFIFFPTIVIGYLAIPKKDKNIFLLLASLLFYLWGEPNVIPLIISVLSTYISGYFLSKKELSTQNRKTVLISGITINLLVLFYFKYIGFFTATVQDILLKITGQSFPIIEVALPLGISFYVFQAIAYLVDSYRDRSLAEKKPLPIFLYITLFPQLIAGPIVRYKEIAKEIKNRSIGIENITQGINRFIIGLSKKVLIANNLNAISTDLLDHSMDHNVSLLMAWFGALVYGLQIYYDFSGYSDMAIGIGRIFGFKFPENFNYPYISKSIREFWRRWHISLSSWFKDYLYIPLGGNKKGETITYRNLLIVFLLTGLWHGASWNFMIWGLYHGGFIIIERLFLSRYLSKLPAIFSRIYFLGVVLVSWVIFRIESIDVIKFYLKRMLDIRNLYFNYEVNNLQLLVIIVAILFSTPILKQLSFYKKTDKKTLCKVFIYSGLIILFILNIIFLSGNTHNPFIYFRF